MTCQVCGAGGHQPCTSIKPGKNYGQPLKRNHPERKMSKRGVPPPPEHPCRWCGKESKHERVVSPAKAATATKGPVLEIKAWVCDVHIKIFEREDTRRELVKKAKTLRSKANRQYDESVKGRLDSEAEQVEREIEALKR